MAREICMGGKESGEIPAIGAFWAARAWGWFAELCWFWGGFLGPHPAQGRQCLLGAESAEPQCSGLGSLVQNIQAGKAPASASLSAPSLPVQSRRWTWR